MDQPLVKHYRLATRELSAWGEPVCQATMDRHVVAQLTDDAYHKVGMRPMRANKPLYAELTDLTMPTPVRVEGEGPWIVRRCDCCDSCLVICTCRPTPCQCEAPVICTVREFMTNDDYHVAPHGAVDPYRLAERLTGESIDQWPYADFRVVDAVIGRSIDSPFWPWTSPTSESPPGD